MEKYIPDMYQKSIYDVNYEKLYKNGIRCILFNIDNTLVPISSDEIDDKVKELFNNIKKMGIKPILYSNSSSKRTNIFKELLGVDGYAKVYKPFCKKFNNILAEFKEPEIALIGDNMLKDITFGNKVVITTILVNPISKVRGFRRRRENFVMKKLRKNNLFVKGRYYE